MTKAAVATKSDKFAWPATTPPHIAAYIKKYPLLPDGVYVGLSNERYHADPALGSSNIRDILKGANLYWFKSWMNPTRAPDKATPSKILGSATHALLLDGWDVFKDAYLRGPYSSADDHLSPAEKSALTKAAKAKLKEGQELLTADDYDFVLGCKDVLDRDPELKGCLDNGLSEVSIFWTRPDGVRMKARLDKLKLRGIGDIKTIANERERDLEVACKLDIANYRYDIPAEHYSEGRRQMAMLLEGRDIYFNQMHVDDLPNNGAGGGKPTEIIDFLQQCSVSRSFGFQFVFIPKKGAPDAWSCSLTPGNPILTMAATDIETAVSFYKVNMAKHGYGHWYPGREVAELAIEEMPFSFGRTPVRRY